MPEISIADNKQLKKAQSMVAERRERFKSEYEKRARQRAELEALIAEKEAELSKLEDDFVGQFPKWDEVSSLPIPDQVFFNIMSHLYHDHDSELKRFLIALLIFRDEVSEYFLQKYGINEVGFIELMDGLRRDIFENKFLSKYLNITNDIKFYSDNRNKFELYHHRSLVGVKNNVQYWDLYLLAFSFYGKNVFPKEVKTDKTLLQMGYVKLSVSGLHFFHRVNVPSSMDNDYQNLCESLVQEKHEMLIHEFKTIVLLRYEIKALKSQEQKNESYMSYLKTSGIVRDQFFSSNDFRNHIKLYQQLELHIEKMFLSKKIVEIAWLFISYGWEEMKSKSFVWRFFRRRKVKKLQVAKEIPQLYDYCCYLNTMYEVGKKYFGSSDDFDDNLVLTGEIYMQVSLNLFEDLRRSFVGLETSLTYPNFTPLSLDESLDLISTVSSQSFLNSLAESLANQQKAEVCLRLAKEDPLEEEFRQLEEETK